MHSHTWRGSFRLRSPRDDASETMRHSIKRGCLTTSKVSVVAMLLTALLGTARHAAAIPVTVKIIYVDGCGNVDGEAHPFGAPYYAQFQGPGFGCRTASWAGDTPDFYPQIAINGVAWGDESM